MIGDLAPAANEFIYSKLYQATDPEDMGHHLRGVLSSRTRSRCPRRLYPRSTGWTGIAATLIPKSFKVNTARISDDRFYGVVVREFGPGERRTQGPLRCWART